MPYTLTNAQFTIDISPATGSITRISHPEDPHGMNWVVEPGEQPWHEMSHNWGLGYAGMYAQGAPLFRWQEPLVVTAGDDEIRVTYAGPGLRIEVTRAFDADGAFIERYAFINETDGDLALRMPAIYTPFNDNYPNAETCVTRRCNAHLWCGDGVAYTCCLRMGGEAPHLGLVLTEGRIDSYSVQGRDDQYTFSNIRGDLILHPTDLTLPPHGSATVAWKCFWHTGWEDFFAQARQVPGFLQVTANRYTLFPGETLTVQAQGASPDGMTMAIGEAVLPVTVQDGTAVASVPATEPGEMVVDIRQGDTHTLLRALVSDPVLEVVRRRLHFIIDKQQIRDPQDDCYGAALVYDRETGSLWRGDWPADHNEGRERVGMGVLMACYLQREEDPKVQEALTLYHRFVRNRLQDADGNVYESRHQRETHLRMYNFPLVANLYLEMFNATGDGTHLEDFVRTMRAFYARGGHRFYAIDIPVHDSIVAMEQVCMPDVRDALLEDYRRQAERIMENGTLYPAHEVNYEQTIVGPAAIFLLEMALVTGERRYLQAAEPHLRCLEAFNGKQPDYHLHEVAIRHWDAYWFGKYRVWGDTFPHYWSTVTANAFARFYQATGEEGYKLRAETILRNNLCLYDREGWGSCAYIYPRTSCGRWGNYADPNANDQDWALVHYLQMADVLEIEL